MDGKVIQQKDVQLFASKSRGELFRSTLNAELLPVENLSAGWYSVEGGCSNHEDIHDVHEYYFIVEGEAKIYFDGVEHQMSAGDTIFVPAGCTHQINNDTESRMTLVYLFAPPSSTPSTRPSMYEPVVD